MADMTFTPSDMPGIDLSDAVNGAIGAGASIVAGVNTITGYGLPTNLPTTFSSDAEQKKWKDKGYIFMKDGSVWNATQSSKVGSWDVQSYIAEQEKAGKSKDEILKGLDEGVTYDKGSDGTYTPRGSKSPQAAGTTHAGKQPTGGAQTTTGAGNKGNQGTQSNPAAGSGGFDIPQVSPGGTVETSQGGIQLGGGGGGASGAPPIDPNAPLGIGFGGAEGSFTPGAQQFNDPGVFNQPNSFTQGLDRNSSLNDILLGAMGEQRATRDAALGIQGGLATSFEGNAMRGQNEQNALALGANPFSLDANTQSQIMGQMGDTIGQNTERLKQMQAARAASNGISRSGVSGAQMDRLDINGMNQLGNAQRGLAVEAATRRPQELASAIGVGNDTLQQQQAARERIAGGAVGILEGSNVTADAALLGSMAQGGTPQVNIARGGTSGPLAGINYSGPRNLNPYN